MLSYAKVSALLASTITEDLCFEVNFDPAHRGIA